MKKNILILICILILILVNSMYVLAVNDGTDDNSTEPIKEAKKEEFDYFSIIIIVIVIVVIIGLPIILVIVALHFTNRKLSEAHSQLQAGYGQFPMVPPPPCPDCNSGLIFANEYRKWYCENCNRYF